MTDNAIELEEKLAVLRQSYIAQLESRFESLEAAFNNISQGSDFATAKVGLEQLSFNAHKLAGTAGTFGFADLGEKGAEIEAKCDELVNSETTPSAEDKQNLAEMIAACRSLADA